VTAMTTYHFDTPRAGREPHMAATLALTVKQATVLWVVEQDGPVSVADVAHHILVSDGVARGVLNRLERRGLVGRTYTGHGRYSVFAFEITAKGSTLLADLDTDSLEEQM
jgi:DNA-binding MarR family transcriptional regulator